jgi:dolichyl-phosphate-mannose--protein O-mannosyl transferase
LYSRQQVAAFVQAQLFERGAPEARLRTRSSLAKCMVCGRRLALPLGVLFMNFLWFDLVCYGVIGSESHWQRCLALLGTIGLDRA